MGGFKDIGKADLDPEDSQKGFKLTFHFAENPFFTDETIWKEYHTQESSPYTGDMDATEIKCSEINWKPGKNVTVEKAVKKKVKGGGAKKNKQKAKETEEPRDSFFRNFFRNLRPDMPVPEDVNLDEARDLCDDSDGEGGGMMELLMENDLEIGSALREQLVPYAVRWFTGEARPEGCDDEDDEGEEEEEEDDDEEEDEDEEEEPPSKSKFQPKKRAGTGGADEKKKGPAGDQAKQEECKQQ